MHNDAKDRNSLPQSAHICILFRLYIIYKIYKPYDDCLLSECSREGKDWEISLAGQSMDNKKRTLFYNTYNIINKYITYLLALNKWTNITGRFTNWINIAGQT